jgi:hypothetical protein
MPVFRSKGKRGVSKNYQGNKSNKAGKRGHKRLQRIPKSDEEKKAAAEQQVLDLDVDKDAGEYFRTNALFDQHYDAQNQKRDRYAATIMAFDHYSIDIVANAKARSLAVALARHDKELIEYFLHHNRGYGFVDMLKAVTILDSAREKRALEKKIEQIQTKTNSVIKPKKLAKFKVDINNLEKMKPKAGSFSGAMQRFVKKWVKTFSESDLEYFALNLPTEPWRKLANMAHLHPEKDFPTAKWFLPYCFGKECTENQKVLKCKNMSADNINELIKEFGLSYSYVKKFQKSLSDESKKLLAEKEKKLDTILWYYEDLACKSVDDIIRSRLELGETIQLGYGKLMERLLMFKDLKDKRIIDDTVLLNEHNSLFSLIIPQAEKDLKGFKATIPSPVAVIGDASGSMSVAIRTATIISSLLTAICSAKLSFFNHKNFYSDNDPKSIAEVLGIAYKTEAEGSTAPAASLVPYFDKKEIIKTFIIVTDEEENADGKTLDGRSWRFFQLFMEYRKEVYPASLIFVSFLRSQHNQGQMYREFVRENVPDVQQFKFCGARPDLTKLDTILGSICSKSSETFGAYVENVESDIKSKGLIQTVKDRKKLKYETNNQLKVEDVVSKPIVY